MQFITTIPIFTTKNGKWGMILLRKKAEVPAFIIILPHPICQCWGIRHWLLTKWLNSTLIWMNGGHFSPKLGKMCQHFFHDCRWLLLVLTRYEVYFMYHIVTENMKNTLGLYRFISYTSRERIVRTICYLMGSQLDVFPEGHNVHHYHKFKLWYLKNLNMFSIKIKELFGPIVLYNKLKGFCFIWKHLLEKPIF